MTKISWWKTNFGEAEIEHVVQSIRHKNVSQGKVTADFENKLADFLEVGHVVAASSGSSSLLMSLMAIGIKPSDEVILPNRTWIATAHAVHLLGAKVVLVDVEKKRLAIDVHQIESKITTNTRAIVPVHMNGRSCDMDKINQIASKHNLYVIEDAAQAILQADALYLGSGAGMGVDSGLPDFRSTEGFWKAYPPVAKLKLRFEEMANPRWFAEDPEFAWGFYGHRLNLYRETIPHEGFGILRKWGDAMRGGAFVYTSNVDGHFQRAGFDKHQVLECHGSLNHLQCLKGCGQEIWSAEHCMVEVDEDTLRAAHPLPSCPTCEELARPNVLMFGDWGWDSSRTRGQQERPQGGDAWLGRRY